MNPKRIERIPIDKFGNTAMDDEGKEKGVGKVKVEAGYGVVQYMLEDNIEVEDEDKRKN